MRGGSVKLEGMTWLEPEVVEKWGIVKSMDVLMAKAKAKRNRAGMTASLWITEALDAVAS